MCGILAILLKQSGSYNKREMRKIAIARSKLMRHRGPDWSGCYMDNNVIMCHERLSIIDVFHGAQPLISKDGNIVLAVNGEIYNYKELRKEFKEDDFMTDSDCEIIINLYQRYGEHFMTRNLLRGMFAFVLYDKNRNKVIVARDHLGIIPLYTGHHDNGVMISSEMKGLSGLCDHIKVFPPGNFFIDGNYHEYYTPMWKYEMGKNKVDYNDLRMILKESVRKHMMSDVPYGVLLSGGIDSSLVASIATRNTSEKLKSFCIGLKGSPDLKAAKEVANWIGTEHYSFEYTIEEGLDALEDVIYHIETYDVTTIRASTPMYLLARRIRAMGIKFVLTGEVSDEISGSYAYFKYAPNKKEFYEETVRKVNDLYKYDLQRANKSMLSWSVEARVPFGDQEVVDYIMNLDPNEKMWNDDKIEKYYLRKAFDSETDPYLPKDMLWRKKEQFSDGVGYNWVDELKKYANDHVTDEDMLNVEQTFPTNPPKSKEEYLYRSIFEKHYPSRDCVLTVPYERSVACSTEKAMEWMDSKQIVDPSGRAVSGHVAELK